MMKNAKRIVFKVGTSTLTYKTGMTNIRHMEELVKVLSDIHNSGIQVVLVTSGAIGVGVGKLGLAAKPADTPGRQAAATVGQCELMFMYDKMFSEYGKTIGQLLITKEDVDDEKRKGNLINAFERLFEYNVIPIINENDSVAMEEIVYGDNDTLSAVIAEFVGADALVIMSDIDGLYTANPMECSGAKLIPVVDEIDDYIISIAKGAGTELGTGGMATKIHAAQIATAAGIDTYVMSSTPISNIYRLCEGESVGTRFTAQKQEK